MKVPIDSISAHPKNYRGHPDAQVDAIRHSLDQFGQYRPVVVSSDGVILAGHGVWLAQKATGATDIDTVRMDFPADDPRAEKLMVADNELARMAQDDDRALAALLADIQRTDGLDGTGWDDGALDALIGELAKQDRANAPLEDPGPEEPPVDPVTKLGDVWLMGEHRLVCGDCTDGDVVSRLFGDKRAQLVFTDPPYGIDYVAQSLVAGQYEDIADDAAKHIGGLYEVWGRVWFANTTDTATCYAFNSPSKPETREGVESAGWQIKDTIVWVKPTFAPGRNDYQNRWESLLYCRKAVGHYWCGRRDLGNVWEFGRDAGVEHPTNKPVELVAHGIDNSSEPGDVVFDSFLGSGTTLIAAEQLGRVCYGIEIEPRYVDVAVRRWCKATSRVATLEATGEPFPMPAPEGA